MRLRFSEHAIRQLAAIFDYIAGDNPEAATMVVGRLRATAHALCLFPNIGHVGHVPGTLEHKVLRLPYVIVYRVEIGDVDNLVVLGVHHGRQSESDLRQSRSS